MTKNQKRRPNTYSLRIRAALCMFAVRLSAHELPVLHIDDDGAVGQDFAGEDAAGNQGLNTALQIAPQGTRTVERIETAVNDEALGEVVGGVTRTVHNDSVGYANIRQEPGLNSKVFFKIDNGEKVYTTGKTKKKDGYVWYEINLAGAYDTGWIAGSLIGY